MLSSTCRRMPSVLRASASPVNFLRPFSTAASSTSLVCSPLVARRTRRAASASLVSSSTALIPVTRSALSSRALNTEAFDAKIAQVREKWNESSWDQKMHWTNNALAVLTPVALVLSPSVLNYPVDFALGLVIPVHMHIGLHTVLTDYIPRPLQGISTTALWLVTLVTIIGLLKLNLSGAGITESFKSLWREPAPEKAEKAEKVKEVKAVKAAKEEKVEKADKEKVEKAAVAVAAALEKKPEKDEEKDEKKDKKKGGKKDKKDKKDKKAAAAAAKEEEEEEEKAAPAPVEEEAEAEEVAEEPEAVEEEKPKKKGKKGKKGGKKDKHDDE